MCTVPNYETYCKVLLLTVDATISRPVMIFTPAMGEPLRHGELIKNGACPGQVNPADLWEIPAGKVPRRPKSHAVAPAREVRLFALARWVLAVKDAGPVQTPG